MEVFAVAEGLDVTAVQKERDSATGKWAGSAQDYFFIPGADTSLFHLGRPEWLIRRAKGARVRQYARSDYDNIQRRLERNLEERWHKTPIVFETNTVPAVAEGALFSAGSLQINGKWLANGASGDRIFTRFLKHNASDEAVGKMISFFREVRAGTDAELPAWGGDAKAVPVGIECRNRVNYYHFMTETLPQLSHFCDGHAGSIAVHCRNAQASRFSEDFTKALFPELAQRILFTDRACRYEYVVIPMNARHLVTINGDRRIQNELLGCREDPSWQDLTAHTQSRKFVLKNTFDRSLRLMRERALSKVSGLPAQDLPKRIFVVRDPRNDAINQRGFYGQDMLWNRLQELGFEKVYFERLTPLEQIAYMNAAEVVVSAHGAFFANMMFANPDAHMIEIGSVQTQLHRWGDFLGNAHVAGCRYSVVFADLAQEDPAVIPPITDGLIGVQVGKAALDLICDLAQDGQPD
jgi:hypothetical protein